MNIRNNYLQDWDDDEERERRKRQLAKCGFYYTCSREPKITAKRQNMGAILHTLIDYEGLTRETIYG